MENKKGKKFGFYFAIATSIMVALAMIVTAAYSTNCINAIIRDYKASSDKYDSFILRMLQGAIEQDVENGNFSETEKSYNFINKEFNYIGYAFLYDTNTGEVLWTPNSENYKDYKAQELIETVVPELNSEHDLDTKTLTGDPYTLTVGLTKSSGQDESYKNMLSNLELYVILFLMLSVVISAYLSKKINKPLMDVVSGVQDFGKGNFSNKLKETGFEEIDQLVIAYNQMASQLLDLYESLEAKVNERTKELEEANLKLKETQTMMVHSEKMRSLGELVAGIAHEINNPVNFIYGNIMILDNYQKDLIGLIDKYTLASNELCASTLQNINEEKQKIDFDFLKDDIGDLIKSCIEGVERTKNIILDLKNFSRMDEMVFSECDIPKEIDTTLNILNNKIKNRITLHKEYEEGLPKIEAFGGQINQVFMNILDNAQGAIKGKGDIYIKVKRDGANIIIQFEDTGTGIKPENLNKVFEPFFTTKPVGQGTGLGMSIAYRVIEAHKGKITVDSEVGVGTKFTIVLPIEHKREEAEQV